MQTRRRRKSAVAVLLFFFLMSVAAVVGTTAVASSLLIRCATTTAMATATTAMAVLRSRSRPCTTVCRRATTTSRAADNTPYYDDGYKTLGAGSHQKEMEAKKSRFVGYACRVASWEDAQACIEGVKREHPKARHWCYGFRCRGAGSDRTATETERCSDDGEPTGTAGVPILGAIKGEDLSDVVCVVVRFRVKYCTTALCNCFVCFCVRVFLPCKCLQYTAALNVLRLPLVCAYFWNDGIHI